jgi:anti-sigma-K factor RskA
MVEQGDHGDIDGLAAEYVLGTLESDERRAVEARLPTDRVLSEAVAGWQRRLEPLHERFPAATASPDLLARIWARIDGAGANFNPGKIIRLEARLKAWRVAAFASGALAAGLAAIVIGRELTRPPGGSMVAVLQADGKAPAFLAAVDLSRGLIAIRRYGAEPVSGRSYELWAVGGGRSAPQSLGVIDASLQIPADRLGRLDAAVLGDTTFAISIEPVGGSPTGAPTGPVVYTGKLLPASR